MEVPETLVARRKARDDAGESAAAAASARKALVAELDAAKAALAGAERSVREAALAIVLAEKERIAARLDATKKELWKDVQLLRGLSQSWFPTGQDQAPRPARLSPQMLAAIEVQEPQYAPLLRPEARYAAAWKAFYSALLADPEATFDGVL